jgi:hypothetical protein
MIFVLIVAYDQLLIEKKNDLRIIEWYTNLVRSQIILKCVGATIPWQAILWGQIKIVPFYNIQLYNW